MSRDHTINGGSMSLADKILKDMNTHTPDVGFNLCGIDEFEQAGEALFIIKHFNANEEALKAQKEYKGKSIILSATSEQK